METGHSPVKITKPGSCRLEPKDGSQPVRRRTKTAQGIPGMQTGALTYFLFTLAWSSAFWAASVRWDARQHPADSLVFLVGGAGPFIAATVLTHFWERPATRRDFWVRVFDPRLLRWPWWAAALFLRPVIIALAFAADIALGGSPPPLQTQLSSPSAVVSFLFFVFWFGPLPEEIGWRGFALDRLQSRMTALHASLALGAVWALWHVPLFFVPGSFQAQLGAGSLRSWMFFAHFLPVSVLMTWVYNNTARSTLSAVLIHFSGNLCGFLVPWTDRVDLLELIFLTVAASLVVLGWGARRLTHSGLEGPAGSSLP